MNHNDLLTQKKLLLTNLLEVDYIRNSDGIDLPMLNSYYVSEWALITEHLEIVSQMEQ
ncbi:hypothetical protein GO755_34675 [Spirosoma sp. HMF4905]|uniref:Uncharacterized protein n=1 Tax=Spirosoma arboris TaxID=2682092 RepID=A0A7K1SN44_9BACT|nr:hypothetical protein [Spirosoma arboris]MVM35219.1 hypothetical protein [Spirosoma arboris]